MKPSMTHLQHDEGCLRGEFVMESFYFTFQQLVLRSYHCEINVMSFNRTTIAIG